ncbi:MAG: flagellar hook-length control protein FliK [Succinivibrionaceae bacterium]|nr:flagellar hook-length control protein FliK [Succinivibrionaceae bacterium]
MISVKGADSAAHQVSSKLKAKDTDVKRSAPSAHDSAAGAQKAATGATADRAPAATGGKKQPASTRSSHAGSDSGRNVSAAGKHQHEGKRNESLSKNSPHESNSNNSPVGTDASESEPAKASDAAKPSSSRPGESAANPSSPGDLETVSGVVTDGAETSLLQDGRIQADETAADLAPQIELTVRYRADTPADAAIGAPPAGELRIETPAMHAETKAAQPSAAFETAESDAYKNVDGFSSADDVSEEYPNDGTAAAGIGNDAAAVEAENESFLTEGTPAQTSGGRSSAVSRSEAGAEIGNAEAVRQPAERTAEGVRRPDGRTSGASRPDEAVASSARNESAADAIGQSGGNGRDQMIEADDANRAERAVPAGSRMYAARTAPDENAVSRRLMDTSAAADTSLPATHARGSADGFENVSEHIASEGPDNRFRGENKAEYGTAGSADLHKSAEVAVGSFMNVEAQEETARVARFASAAELARQSARSAASEVSPSGEEIRSGSMNLAQELSEAGVSAAVSEEKALRTGAGDSALAQLRSIMAQTGSVADISVRSDARTDANVPATVAAIEKATYDNADFEMSDGGELMNLLRASRDMNSQVIVSSQAPARDDANPVAGYDVPNLRPLDGNSAAPALDAIRTADDSAPGIVFAQTLHNLALSRLETAGQALRDEIVEPAAELSGGFLSTDLSGANFVHQIERTASGQFAMERSESAFQIEGVSHVHGPVEAASGEVRDDPALPDQLQKAMRLSRDYEENARQVAEKINIMLARNLKEAEINLDPAGLGKIRITVNMSEDGIARVNMVVQQGETRELISDSMSRLRSMLDQQGISLGESSVRQQDSWGDRSQNQGSSATNTAASDKMGAEEAGAETEGQAVAAASSAADGEVDYYA